MKDIKFYGVQTLEYFKKHPYIGYTVFFLLILAIGLLPIEIKNKSFLFSGLFVTQQGHFDALKQHLIFMEDYVSSIKSFLLMGESLILYRRDLGLGGDFILNYTYYSLFDPTVIIAYIIPIQHIETSYYLILMLRIYLSGLFMMLLAHQLMILKPSTRIMAGLLYAFSALTLFSAFRHPMFTNGVMYLPLLMIGAERIIEKKSPILFVFVTFLAVISQFYIFIFTLFGFAIYLFTRTFENQDKKKWIVFFQIVAFGFISVMMGAFVLLPQALALMEGSRTSSKGLIGFSGFDLSSIVISHIVPVMGNKYSIGLGNIVLLLGVFVYLFSKKVPLKWVKYSLIIFLILNFISPFAFAINGFSYVNNRWTYVLLVPSILAFSAWIDGKIDYSHDELTKALKSLFFIVLLIPLFLVAQLGINHFSSLLLDVLFVLMIVSFFLLLCFKIWNKHLFFEKYYTQFNLQFIKGLSIVSLFIVTLAVAFYYTGSLTPNHALSTYYPDRDRYDEFFDKSSFYRVEQKLFSGNIDSFSNDNLLYNYYSTYQYNTMASGYINQFLTHLEVTNHNNTVGYNGFSFRTKLLSLHQVNYVIIRESEKTIPPYGFQLKGFVMVEKYDESKIIQDRGGNILYHQGVPVLEKAFIYENMNTVSFGYMAYHTISDTQYLSLDPLDQEDILLTHVVLQKDIFNEEIPVTNSTLYVDVVPEIIDNQQLKVVIPRVLNEEVYLKLEGFHFDMPIKTHTKTSYSTSSMHVKEINYKKGTHMYVENQIHLVNLGYYVEEENLEIYIEFEDAHITYEKLSYALVSMTGVDVKTSTLNENTLSGVVFNENGFTGTITSNQRGYLVINLPYTKGFKAFVNGIEVDIHQANIGYMAIDIEPGTYEISFMYQTRGLKEGLYLSLLSLLVASSLIVIFHIKNRGNKNFDDEAIKI